MITVKRDDICDVLARLKMAMRPEVVFDEDVERMRQAAREKTLQHVVAAYDLLKGISGIAEE